MNQAHDDHRGRAGRVYLGERTGDLPGDTAVSVEEGGCRRPLPHLVHHSPDGLSWGYHGSGPADTALSILADALGERPTPAQLRRGEARCWRWHQAFKRDVIAGFPLDAGWRLPLAEVEAWIARRREREAADEAADDTRRQASRKRAGVASSGGRCARLQRRPRTGRDAAPWSEAAWACTTPGQKGETGTDSRTLCATVSTAECCWAAIRRLSGHSDGWSWADGLGSHFRKK